MEATNPFREDLATRTRPEPCTVVIFGASGDLTGRKLIPALYNIAADPGEKNNLAAKEPAKTAALRNMLHEWRRRVGAKMPTPNPDFKTDKKPNPENP